MTRDHSFLSTSGYWVHQNYLAEPIQEVDDNTQSQDRYTFVSTSRTEHGDKDQAMTVRTVRVFQHKNSGHRWVEQSPHWKVSRTLKQGRKLYKQLLKEGYTADTVLIGGY